MQTLRIENHLAAYKVIWTMAQSPRHKLVSHSRRHGVTTIKVKPV